ncbi:hypothetical protein AAC387_Pa08g2418 [Persea americana]
MPPTTASYYTKGKGEGNCSLSKQVKSPPSPMRIEYFLPEQEDKLFILIANSTGCCLFNFMDLLALCHSSEEVAAAVMGNIRFRNPIK